MHLRHILAALLSLLLAPQTLWAAGDDGVVVGKVADSHAVTDNGQFTYTMPIAVASGTGGMSPKLSIAYGSSNGTGLLGYGFDLHGLSTISRAPRNLFNDGKADIIRFGAYDRFTLDGRRLQVVGRTDATVEYRTEHDTYARIVSYGNPANPDSFVVWGKEGIRYKYDNLSGAANLHWHLVRATDTKGNYFRVAYRKGYTHEFVPIRIDYTGNNNTGLQPYAAVSLNYRTVSGAPYYISGAAIRRTRLLESIVVTCDGATVRTYTLSYEQKQGRHYLTSVTEGTLTLRKRPTTFTWDNSDAHSIVERKNTDASFKNKAVYTGDFNGDGRTDLLVRANNNAKDYNFQVYLSEGENFSSPQPWTYTLPSQGNLSKRIGEVCVGDFNGDGYDDIVVERANSPFYYLDYWETRVRENGTVTFEYRKTITPPYTLDHKLHVMDANCDGAADLFAYNQNPTGNTYYTLLSTSTDTGVTPLVMGTYGELEGDCWDNPGSVGFIDLDGDGTNEILNVKEIKASNGCGSNLYTISPSTGKLELLTGLTIGGQDKFLIGDFNGDGKTDILQTGSDDNPRWTMNLSRGVVKGRLFQSYYLAQAPFTAKDNMTLVADLDGDGKDDIIALPKKSGAPISLHIGDGMATGFISVQGGVTVSVNDKVFDLGDFNGDGKAELLAHAKPKNGTAGYTIFGTSNTSTCLLTKIHDGLGNATSISYSRLSRSDHFTRGTQTAYPLVSVGCVWPIVASVAVPDGVGGISQTKYHYTDAIFHKRGRGMLGFRQVKATDVNTETTSIREYETARPVMTPALTSERTEIGDRTVAKTSYTNTLTFSRNPQNKAGWVYTCQPTAKKTTTYEYNTGVKLSDIATEWVFDSLGNATRVTVRNGKRKVRTNSAYYNDTVNWVLGRIALSRVERSGEGQDATVATSFSYNTKTGLLTCERYGQSPYGFEKKYEYDAYGNITRDIVTASEAAEPRQTTTEYDARGRFKTASVNALGHRTTYEVDDKMGVVTRQTDPLGITTTYAYDSFGTLLKETDPFGKTTHATGWSKGQPRAPQGAVWYERVERTGESPVTSFFDCLGRTIRTVTRSGDESDILLVDTEYDNCGRVHTSSNPYFPQYSTILNTTEYDKAGRMVSYRNVGGYVTRYTYDGLRTITKDPYGGTHTRVLDTDGRLVESVDALGASVRYTYDINDNCTEVQGPGTTIRTEFDGGGRKTRILDPDLGEVTYTHNGFGELTSQTNSKGTATYEYDRLGRLVKETRPDFEYHYTYDKAKPGLLDSKTCSNGTSVEYNYDDYGRVVVETHTMRGKTFKVSTTYNDVSQPATITYPSGFVVSLNYFDTGRLRSVSNATTGEIIWEATWYDELGHAAGALLGNGHNVFTGYNPTGTVAQANIDEDLVCWYDYDGNNCLMHKYDAVRNNEEYYDYDAENRLTSVTTTANDQGEREIQVEYDASGNVVRKTGVGMMSYQEGTNRLETVTGYELPEWEKVSYTSFNKISEVIAPRDGSSLRYFLTLTYGPDKTRCMQGMYPPSVIGTKYDFKYYVGNLYDEANYNGDVLKQDYIYADGKLVAIHQTDDHGERIQYVHLDHLGSVWAITGDNGAVVAEYNYDPWGRRRNPETWDYYDGYEQQNAADRGFGGHEQLDVLDMVNMGGRMYDPYMGRFLSPDPYVQAPDNTQSLNRYAYCLNNPLSLTDPTGYSWLGNFFSAAVGIAVGVETFGIGSGVLGAMASGACASASSAFASTLMNGANLWTATKSAFVGGCWGALGSAVNYGIGEIGGGWLARVSLHSVADGAMEALQGGHWEHGLMTGLASAGGGELLSNYGTYISDAQILAGTATLGGVVSEIGGGKFANGAMTAAFQMMYNHFYHQGPTFKQLEKIDAIYRKSLADYPNASDFYRSVGLPEYDNGCAARLSYALNESGTKLVPHIKGQTRRGSDGKNYFMFAKDMRRWFHKIWGAPRVYHLGNGTKLKNGIVAQYGFKPPITGHIEYFYTGHDGHVDYNQLYKNNDDEIIGAHDYYKKLNITTELWKCGLR